MRIFGITLIIFASSLGVNSLQAREYCAPKDNTARILTKASPNAIHPDYGGSAYVGTGWAFIPKKHFATNTGEYAKGDLLGSRGGVVNRNVFILISEWACQEDSSNATRPSPIASPAGWSSTTSSTSVNAKSRSISGREIIHVSCSTRRGGASVSFGEYSGKGLKRIDDGEDAVAFVVTLRSGSDQTYHTRMHYFEPDREWVLSGDLPLEFVRDLGLGKLLTLTNEGGQQIATFDLTSAVATSHALASNCKWDVALNDNASPASPPPAQINVSGGCGGHYLRVNTSDNRLYTPILSATLQQLSLSQDLPSSSWSDVKCDSSNRPTSIHIYKFGQLKSVEELEYFGSTRFLQKIVSKDSGVIHGSITTIQRDGQNRPTKIIISDLAGKPNKTASVSYNGGGQHFHITNGDTGALLYDATKWFATDETISKAHWYYPSYWYEYFYDPKTGNSVRALKYAGRSKIPFEEVAYQFDEFGNTVGRQERCLTICEFVSIVAMYHRGLMAREDILDKAGNHRIYGLTYDDSGLHLSSTLRVNDRFIAKLVVERNGTTVLRTTAYDNDGQKLVIYPNLEVFYINRDGSPSLGGKFDKLIQGSLW